MGIRRTKWRVTSEPRKGAKYRPLADSGPAGELRAPDKVRITIDVEYPARDEGRPRVGGAELDLELVDGRYRVVRLEAIGPADAWLDLEAVRAMQFRRLVREGLANGVELTRGGEVYSRDRKLPGADPLEYVALTYAVARALNEDSTAAVADELGITHEAASQRVYRARLAGFLPPTEPGKVS